MKTKNGIIGLDATANLEDCRSSMVTKARLSSIMQWAQESGKDTGEYLATIVQSYFYWL